jgi:hypothetical protein
MAQLMASKHRDRGWPELKPEDALEIIADRIEQTGNT